MSRKPRSPQPPSGSGSARPGPSVPPRGRSAEEALRRSEERYRELVEHLPVGVYRTTPRGRIIEANPALAQLLGFADSHGLLRANVKDFYVKKADRMRHLRKLKTSTTYFTEFELRRPDGQAFWVRDYPRAVRDPEGKVLYYDGIIVDITERRMAERNLARVLRELKKSNELLAGLSLSDDLTKLSNRRGFFTLGEQQMRIARRLRRDVFLLFVDLDNLKWINDTHGHAAGDEALIAAAGILKATLRDSDLIGRIGGDEFAVLAIRSAVAKSDSLRRRLEERVKAFNRQRRLPIDISLSLGLVRFDPNRFATIEDFLARADRLMYRQKQLKRRSESSRAGMPRRVKPRV